MTQLTTCGRNVIRPFEKPDPFDSYRLQVFIRQCFIQVMKKQLPKGKDKTRKIKDYEKKKKKSKDQYNKKKIKGDNMKKKSKMK